MKGIKFLPPLIIIPVLFLFIYRKPVTVYPGKGVRFYKYSDVQRGGNSALNAYVETDSLVSLKYTLKKGIEFPYAGLNVQLDSGYFPDLSRFDYMDLDAITLHSRAIQIFLNVYEPGITKEYIPLSYRHVLYEAPSRKDQDVQRIWLKDFRTPVWWYAHVNLSEKDLGEPHLDKVKGISFSNSLVLPLNMEETLTIRRIAFGKDYTVFLAWSLAGTLLYYSLLFGIVFLRKKLLNVPSRIIPYKQIEILDQGNPMLQKSIEYLGQNYTNANLSLSDMAKDLGFSARNISDQIKQHFNLTFKQYLNGIRLNEARRLLKETALPVNEIAWKVGFNNISHFNRAFRQYSDCSPQEFRQKK